MTYVNEMKSTVTTFEELPNNCVFRDCVSISSTFGQLFLKSKELNTQLDGENVAIQLTGKQIGKLFEFYPDNAALKIDSDSLIR